MPRRRQGTKSRNGCITCKFRHVKCDEAKPACEQCTSTGRKCDGYNDQSQRQLRQGVAESNQPLSRTSSPNGRLVLVPGTREEREYIHLFCTQTSKSLSGFFPSDLWLYHLPQLSQSEPAIRHAIAAISATHKQIMEPGTDPGVVEPFALEQYNKAIRCLVPTQQGPHPNLDRTLITCGLFVCLEIMKKNYQQAMDHAQAGLRILCARRQQQATESDEDDGNKESKASADIDRELSDFFSRMNLEVSFFGRPLAPYKVALERPMEGVTGFANISQAREILLRLLTLAFWLIKSIGMNINRAGLSDADRQEYLRSQAILKQECKAWRTAFEKFKKTRLASGKNKTSMDPRAPLVLQVQFLTIWIWLHTCLAEDEMMYDDFNHEFEELVAAAEQIAQLTSPNQRTEIFSLETYAIGSLYWTARKCRHPIIRRRAIAAIETYPRQEGMWSARQDYVVATYNMELEEAALAHLPVEQRVPENQYRYFDTSVLDTNNPCPVSFLSRPRQAGDDWDYRVEFVDW